MLKPLFSLVLVFVTSICNVLLFVTYRGGILDDMIRTVGAFINYQHQMFKMISGTEKTKTHHRTLQKFIDRNLLIISDTIFVQEKQWPNFCFNQKSVLGILASFKEATSYIFGKLRLVRLRRTSQKHTHSNRKYHLKKH